MRLAVPTQDDVEQARVWRNIDRHTLRTPHMLTVEQQEDFYTDVICDRDSRHKYYSIIAEDVDGDEQVFGFGGLTNIDWVAGNTEISLIMRPEVRGMGYGRLAVRELLTEAFDNLRLETVYGEVYDCGHRSFWRQIAERYNGYMTGLINRKWWDGVMWGSLWFAVTRDNWESNR